MVKKSSIFVIFFLCLVALFHLTTSRVYASKMLLEPNSINIAEGDTFNIKIIIDTEGKGVYGASSIINFDPKYLQVLSIDYQNKVFGIYPAAIPGNDEGKIQISGITASVNKPYSGSGTFAIVTFQAIGQGSTNLDFDFTPGQTNDSNATTLENDIVVDTLNKVDGATVSIEGGDKQVPTPTPTSAPTPTPTPTLISTLKNFIDKIIDKITSLFVGEENNPEEYIITSGETKTALNKDVSADPQAIAEPVGEQPANAGYGLVALLGLVLIAITILISILIWRKKSGETPPDNPPDNPSVS